MPDIALYILTGVMIFVAILMLALSTERDYGHHPAMSLIPLSIAILFIVWIILYANTPYVVKQKHQDEIINMQSGNITRQYTFCRYYNKMINLKEYIPGAINTNTIDHIIYKKFYKGIWNVIMPDKFVITTKVEE